MCVTARGRILAIKIMEKQKCNPAFAKQIGIQVRFIKKDRKNLEEKHV